MSPGSAAHLPVTLMEPWAKAQAASADSPSHAFVASGGGPWWPGGGPLGRHASPLLPSGGASHVPDTVRSPMVKLQVAPEDDEAHAVVASGGGPR